jgi:hypothetical protein
MKYSLIVPKSFFGELEKLDEQILSLFEKKLALLQQNPKHKSLRTHQVGKSANGEAIWSSSINMSNRFTWQYGPEKSQITLRHIGCHKIYRSP